MGNRTFTRLGGVGLAVLLAGGLGTGSVWVPTAAVADAPPQRVLQSVSIDLGTDGTLYAIDSTAVRKSEDGTSTSDSAQVPVAKNAGSLPVRVTTTYVAGDRSGTDLSDLKGYTGRVQINVTVQNTTVRAEPLSYDDDNAKKDTYALVGAPLTVVASADLGNAVGQVVTDSDAGGAVTNGVLSQDQSGSAQVQWAAILAPPRLAPNSTFSLVMDAKDFSMPAFDISVQPGLAADSSIEGLLTSAFSDDSGSQLALESQTIDLVTKVTTVLAQAGRQLGRVKKQLDFSSKNLGDKTINDLASGTQTVAASTQQLVGQLQALQSSVGNSLDTTQTTANSAIDASIANVVKLLGDTSTVPTPPVVTGAGCGTQVDASAKSATVYGQLNTVITLLQGLSGATSGCSLALTSSLQATIGSVDAAGNAVCSPGSTSAICTIDSVQGELSGIGTDLGNSLRTASDTLNTLPVQDAVDKATAIGSLVTTLQQQATDLQQNGTGGTGSIASLIQALLGVLNQIKNLVSAGSSVDDIGHALDDIQHGAQAQLTDLAGEPNGGSHKAITDQLAALKSAICSTGSAYSISDPDLKNLLALAGDTDCSGVPLTGSTPGGFSAPLNVRLQQQAQGWQDVIDATGNGSDARTSAAQLTVALNAIAATLSGLLDDAGGEVSDKLDDLVSALDGLYDPTVTSTLTCASDPTHLDAVNRLQLAVLQITCSASGVNAALATQFAGLQDRIRTSADQVHAQLRVVDDSRVRSGSDLANLFLSAGQGLDGAASTIAADGKSTVTSQAAALNKESKSFKKVLGTSVNSALKQIDSQVTSSNRDLETTNKLLSKDLDNVLSDLGSRGDTGSGLLGIIQGQAAQTRTSAARLGDAGSAATQFGNVRSANLSSIFLQQAQLSRALELQSQLPPFALSLPAGSQSVTVYSFHMRGIG